MTVFPFVCVSFAALVVGSVCFARRRRYGNAGAAAVGPETLFRDAFERCPDGLAICDAKSGAVTRRNAAFEPFERVLRETPDAREAFASALGRAQDCGAASLDRVRSAEGLVFGVVMTRLDAAGVLVSARDVSAHDAAEEALRESEERFRLFSEAAHEAVIFHRDGVVTDVNERVCEMFGWRREELLGRDGVEMFFPPERREEVRGRVRDEREVVYPTEGLRRTGERFPCEVIPVKTRGPGGGTRVACIRDISTRKAGEAAMCAQISLMEATLDAVGDGVLVVDRAGGVVMFNAKFAEMWRIPKTPCGGRYGTPTPDQAAAQLAEPEEFLAKLREIRTALSPGESDVLLLRDGRIFERQGRPRVADGEVVGRVWTFHDATALMTAQRELRELNAGLERRVEERTRELERTIGLLRESNAELESFSRSVSHDLRAPLRAMDGLSLALLEDHGALLDDRGRDHLRRIRAGATRMGRIMDDILHLSRVGRMHVRRERVNLSEVAAEVMEGLRSGHCGRNVAFHCAPEAFASGDTRLVRVLLENLLGNSWKYTETRDDARIEFGFADGADGLREFFVRDNGAGFDPRSKDRLFTPFTRLHSAQEFEGSGLGLAIVARVVRRMGGEVSADGLPGRGAVFRFTLPRADAAVAPAKVG